MSTEGVNSSIEGRKAGTSGNLIIPSIEGDKIVHLPSCFADGFGHVRGTTDEIAGRTHVSKDQGGIGLVVACHRTASGGICSRGEGNGGRCDGGG